MPSERVESILAADCGSVISKVALIDRVDGAFRFVAIGEALTTPENVGDGLAEAVRDIELKTGRTLLEGHHVVMPEGTDGNGVDAAVLACSAAGPVRLAAVGISSASSLPIAEEVATGAMASVVASVSIEDIRNKDRAERKLAELQETQADAILFVAGAANGRNPLTAELCEFIARASLLGRNSSRLPVIFAGGPSAVEVAEKVLSPLTDLQSTPPVRLTSGAYYAQPATAVINDCYLSRSILGLSGLAALTDDKWSAVLAAPKAIESVAQFISKQNKTDVLVIDLGASASTVVRVSEGLSSMVIATDCGMGSGIYGALTSVNAAEIATWLPFGHDAEHVLELSMNKALRPHSIPQLPEELLIEEAIARAAVKHAARRLKLKTGLMIASGGFFSHLPRRGRVMLLLLDAIQPTGITSVACDPLGLMPSLGVVGASFPQAAGQVIMRDALQHLGTALSLVGSGKEGQIAAHVQVHYDQGGEFQIEVPCGGIEVIPLEEGHRANLVVQPAPEFSLEDSPKGKPLEVEVAGGAVGIVIDARGRPIALPSEDNLRARKVFDWYKSLDM